MTKWAIGIDIGGTKIELGLVNEAGNVLDTTRFDTEVSAGPTAIITDIANAARNLQKRHPTKSPIGIGVGMAGQIVANTGEVFFAPNLKWHHVPLAAELHRLLDLPVHVTDDVRAITLGEWQFGAGRGCKDLVGLFIGTGVGGGIVCAGRLLAGASNTAGELGHMKISLNGRKCSCGNYGCLESIAGGWAIAQRAQEAVAASPLEGKMLLQLVYGEISNITTKEVAEAAQAGDPLAQRIADETCNALILGISSIINALNPERIILGGGVLQGFPWMVDRIAREAPKNSLDAACQNLQIVSSGLSGHGGLIGAACFSFLKASS